MREKSVNYVLGMGLKPNPNLPLLGELSIHKTIESAGHRLLAMNVCVALSYQFPIEKGVEWLKREGAWSALTPDEIDCIESDDIPSDFGWYADSLWSLAWAASLVGPLCPAKGMPDTFVHTFPDIMVMAPSAEFMAKLKFREVGDIVQALDIYYCLHNAIRSEVIGGKTSQDNLILLKTVEYQRHSLEWLLDVCNWDDVSLDT